MIQGLFKYFGTDAYKLSKFVNGRVFLVPPKYFNDPWEFLVRSEVPDEAQVRAQFEKFEYEAGSIRGAEEKECAFQDYRDSVADAGFRAGEGTYLQERLSVLFGVVSLTSDPLNRVMWAHYADSHRGFVAEFKHGTEFEWKGLTAMSTPFGLAVNVPYEATLQRFDTSSPKNQRVFCTKHEAWRYEEELRVIQMLRDSCPDRRTDGQTFFLLNFRPEDLVRIIFGLRVCPDVRQHLLEMLRRPEFAGVESEIVKINPDTGELITAPLRS